ncbi:MAG: hypothetical protein QM750_11815 [Rubrivivax sp.]
MNSTATDLVTFRGTPGTRELWLAWTVLPASPGRDDASARRSARLHVYLDGQEVAPPGPTWDFAGWLAAGRRGGTACVSNCECGAPECARILQPAWVDISGDRLAMSVPLPYVCADGGLPHEAPAVLIFDLHQYRAATVAALETLQTLDSDGGPPIVMECGGNLVPKFLRWLERIEDQRASGRDEDAQEPLVTAISEFEAEVLGRARDGDVSARREAVALAADALRRGIELSPGLRGYLADALQHVLAAAESTDKSAQARALAALGHQAQPAHRKPRNDDERRLRALRRLAAVHLLTARAGSRTKAVDIVADVEGCEPRAVWRDLGDNAQWRSTARVALRLARPVIELARARGLLSRRRPTS